jgi:hypothetical protein
MADHPRPLESEIEAAQRDLCALADPLQLELIRDKVPGRDPGTAVAVIERRGRGRPPGARNKRSVKFRDQILSMGQHPALALQRAYSTPVDVLAAQLGCSRLEAAQLAIRAASELLPYVESKQPVAVDLRQQHDVVLIMGGVPGALGADLEAIAHEVNDDEAPIDWGTATFEELPEAVQKGEPLRDGSTGDDD